MATTIRIGQPSMELGVSSGSPLWGQLPKHLGLSSNAFPAVIAGSWVGSGAAGTGAKICMEWSCPRQWLTPVFYNAKPLIPSFLAFFWVTTGKSGFNIIVMLISIFSLPFSFSVFFLLHFQHPHITMPFDLDLSLLI